MLCTAERVQLRGPCQSRIDLDQSNATGILSAPARILQGGTPFLFGLVLDRGGPLWRLLLSASLTGAFFLAFFAAGAQPGAASVRVRS
jgi:hypothetical protein